MKNYPVEYTEEAIRETVGVFQSYPDRTWNERDIHWILYYQLRRSGIVSQEDAPLIIRAELPIPAPLKSSSEEDDSGYYDIVILEPESFKNAILSEDDSWKEFYKQVKIEIAVEVKLWKDNIKAENVKDKIDWDVEKLTERPDNINRAYFLNFVKLDFDKMPSRDYYLDWQQYLRQYRRPNLKILCVPSDMKVQLYPEDIWL